jgi:hypothetical protein
MYSIKYNTSNFHLIGNEMFSVCFDFVNPPGSRDLQMGVMSPTKLRMKLLGSHGHGAGKKDEASGKSSPSRLEDDDHPKISLLAQELDEGLFHRRVTMVSDFAVNCIAPFILD